MLPKIFRVTLWLIQLTPAIEMPLSERTWCATKCETVSMRTR
jgi:hypothetical protein